MKTATKTTAKQLARIGAARIVASEIPRKPGIPKEGKSIVAAVRLIQKEVGDFDLTPSRIEIIELFGEQFNPRPLPKVEVAAGKKPKRIFEVIVTDEGDVIVCPHIAAQQILAGKVKTDKRAAASKANAKLGGRPKST